MSKEPWLLTHKLALKRVNENINLLKQKDQTLESIFNIIFLHLDYPFLQIMNNYGSVDYSYGDVLKEINQYSSFFNVNIHSSSDYIGIYLDNSKEWIIVFFASLMSGFRPVLLSTANPFIENKSVFEKLHISTIISDKSIDYPGINVINIKEISFNEVKITSTKKFSNEIVFLTSGSTGTSKIVFYTGKEICNTIYNSQGLFFDFPELGHIYKGHVKHLVILPFYHVFGLFAVLLWFSFFNIEFVIPKNLSPKAIKHAISVTEPTHIFAVPLFWETIVSEIKKNISQRGMNKKFEKFIKLSCSLQNIFGKCGTNLIRNIIFKKHLKEILGTSVYFCINGGAPLSDKALLIMNAIGYQLVNGYGSTEIGITSFCSNETFKSRISNSIGKPFKSVEYKIESRSLLVNALSSSKHYIDGEKEYFLNEKEFFNTNDAVAIEKENYYIQGRQDEIVILENGETISIPKIEANISLPLANEFAIVFDFESNSLVLVASYSLAINVQKAKTELTNFKNTQYGKILKNIIFTNQSLPKANTIKIRRNVLLKEIENQNLYLPLKMLEDANTCDQMIQKSNHIIMQYVLDSFKTVFPDKEVEQNSDFYTDLGGDSLKYFLLLNELENRFNVNVDTDKVSFVPRTPHEFVETIGNLYDMENTKA